MTIIVNDAWYFRGGGVAEFRTTCTTSTSISESNCLAPASPELAEGLGGATSLGVLADQVGGLVPSQRQPQERHA